jgi:hypothetical protein
MAEPTSKHLYVWRPAAGTSIASFASFAKADLAEALAGCGADDVSLHLTEAAPPRITPCRTRPSRWRWWACAGRRRR